jgi:MFS family permease
MAAAPPAAPKESKSLGTFRALAHRNYRLYFLGQLVSLTGSWVQAAALTWLAYALTDSSFWPGLIAAAQIVPMLVLGAWGGGLADFWPRRRLIFLTQSALLVLALVLVAMTALESATPLGLLLVATLIGIVNAIDTPARMAFVIDMVGRDDLTNAVALNSLVFNVARALGPAISAVLLELLTPSPCFLINALTFLAVLGALLAMRLPARGQGSPERPVGSILDSLRYLASRRRLVLLLLVAGTLSFFGWPLLALLPALSEQVLGAGGDGYAWMLSGFGVGALLGALLVASYGSRSRRRLFLGTGVVLGGVALAALALFTSLPLAILACTLVGCALILFFSTGQAAMQLGAREHNRGRIMGFWVMVQSGAQPAGNLVAGTLADVWGVPAVLLWQVGGIVVAVLLVGAVALAWRLFWPMR